MTQSKDRTGGRQIGGGPQQSDNSAPGGSSGTGGYGNAQDRQQGRQEQGMANEHDPQQERGDSYDEAQGGGRDEQSLSRRSWDQPQGKGGGLRSQMAADAPGGFPSEETERDAES